MNAINIDGEVSYHDGVFVSSELHLQHALETPAHEGDVRQPRGHCGGKTHTDTGVNSIFSFLNLLSVLTHCFLQAAKVD